MYARYVTTTASDAEREFRIEHPWWCFAPSFNVAPGRNIPVLRVHEGETEGVMLHWGLIPDWAEGDPAKGQIATCSAAELSRSRFTAGAWERQQRCILPAAGFYAWQLTPARYCQPYFVYPAGRPLFAIAALWDRTETEEGDDVIESCSWITVASNSLLRDVNNTTASMPAILERKDYDEWLHGTPEQAASVLRTLDAQVMRAHPISPRVNALRYDDPALISPVEPAFQQRVA